MKRCSKCGVEKEFDSFPARYNQCKECNIELRRARHKAHPEVARARTQRWRAANPERAREQQRKIRAENKERRNVHARELRAVDPEGTRAKDRAARARYRSKEGVIEKERQRQRAWAAANPDAARAKTHRYRSRKRSSFVEDVRITNLYERDKGLCGICNRRVTMKTASIDHIIPVSRGGTHSYANTRIAHLRCNTARGNRGAAQARLLG